MKTVALGDLTETIDTWNPSRNPTVEFRYVDLSAVDNESKQITRTTTFVGAEAPSRARQLLQAGDVLVSTVRPNLNAVAAVPSSLGGATASTGFTVLRPNAHLNPRYLFHWVRSRQFISDMVRKATGASYPAVSDRIVRGSKIPTPPVDEQRRIAAILDHADGLRAKRRQVLAHLDALPQAIFRAMFGDPLSAHGNRVRIGDVATVVTGNSPPRSRPELFGGRLEWIKSDNLGGLVASSATETLSDLGRGLARTAPAGSVLVTCIAGSPQSIGKASLTDREVAFNQQINAVLPCDGLEPHFLLAQLHTAPELIRRKSTGGMKGLVNKSAFQSIEVLAPPFSSQRRFSARLAGIARYRSHIESAALHQDELFASLQSRAFRGEL